MQRQRVHKKILFGEGVVAKLSSIPMILVELRSQSGDHAQYGVQERCLKESGSCEVSEVAICRYTSVIYRSI